MTRKEKVKELKESGFNDTFNDKVFINKETKESCHVFETRFVLFDREDKVIANEELS